MRCWISVSILVFAVVPANGIGQDFLHRGIAKPAVTVSSANLQRAVTRSSDYLVRFCESNGHFVYKVDANTGDTSRSYNIIRHEGAVYALAAESSSHGGSASVDAITRADKFLIVRYVGPGPVAGMQVIWAKPMPDRSIANLGATGLGLVALIALDRVRPGAVPVDQLQALGRFGLFLQRPDGSFADKYRSTTGPDQEFESRYYPGEMALGFLSLYEVDHSKVWLEAAEEALTYLARASANEAAAPPDHWAMIATAKLFEICEKEYAAYAAPRKELIRYAMQVSETLLEDQQQDPTSNPKLFGSFGASGRTTPTATRMEGLLAVLEFLPPGELRTRIERAVKLGINFLVRAQIVEGPYAGGFPRSVVNSEPHASEIRIDYVQHALCAFLRYQQLFGSRV